jgi:hypothetical protein
MGNPIEIKANTNKTFDNFISSSDLSIAEWLIDWERDYTFLKITAGKGNGGSHMIHALANKLKEKEIEYILLDFTNVVEPIDFLTLEIEKLKGQSVLLIDHLDHACSNVELQDALFNFLKDIASRGIKLAFTCSSQFTSLDSFLSEVGFTAPSICMKLYPLSEKLKRDWVSSLGDVKSSDLIPDILFEEETSNKEFLKTIQPFLYQKLRNPISTEVLLKDIEIQLRLIVDATRILTMHLYSVQYGRSESNEKGNYPLAALMRDKERRMNEQISNLCKRANELRAEIPNCKEGDILVLRIFYLIFYIEMDSVSISKLNWIVNAGYEPLIKRYISIKEQFELSQLSMVIKNQMVRIDEIISK